MELRVRRNLTWVGGERKVEKKGESEKLHGNLRETQERERKLHRNIWKSYKQRLTT